MNKLLCVTGNKDKFGHGQAAFRRYGLDLEQLMLDIDEIQGEDPEKIIEKKAEDAYAQVGKPLVVTDDSWSIPGLSGFPGPYMKSINHWLTPDDLIRLTKHLDDRRIYINQFVAYKDGHELVVFRHDIECELLREPKGIYGPSIMKIVSHVGDNGKSIAEMYDAGQAPHRSDENAWYQLAKWYSEKTAV